MSSPRWTCASKISAPAGSSRSSSSSKVASSRRARSSASSTGTQSSGGSIPHRVAQQLLIYADTVRSPDMRHEVPLTVPDAFHYLEVDGERHVVAHTMELGRME